MRLQEKLQEVVRPMLINEWIKWSQFTIDWVEQEIQEWEPPTDPKENFDGALMYTMGNIHVVLKEGIDKDLFRMFISVGNRLMEAQGD